MNSKRKALENFFGKWTAFHFKHPFKILVFWLIVFAVFWSQLPHLVIDPSTEGFFHKDSVVLKEYEDFKKQFGKDEMVIVAIDTPNVFTVSFLNKLRKLHEDLETNVPFLEDMTSLVNARSTYGEGDVLVVEDLLENFPETKKDLDDLKERVMSNPLYKNMMISEDGKATTIVLEMISFTGAEDASGGFDLEDSTKAADYKLVTDEQVHEFVQTIWDIAGSYSGKDFKIQVSGSPVVTDTLKTAMKKNLIKFVLAAVLVIAVFLIFLLKRLSGMILPLIVVISTLLLTLSLMAISGTIISIPTQALPSFILAIGVGDSVHILALFYRDLHRGMDKRRAMMDAMEHSALPVLMTSMTTAISLWSFSTARMAPVADLGIFGGIGVILALLLTLSLLPAMIAVFPVKPGTKADKKSESGWVEAVLDSFAGLSIRYPLHVVLMSFLLLIVFGSGVFKLSFAHNPIEWYSKSDPVRIATEWIDHNLKGSITLEFLIDSGKVNGLYEPEFLNALDSLGDYAKSYQLYGDKKLVGNVISLAQIIKEIHQALNGNQPEFYKIPQDPKLIPQELLLFENSGSDDLQDVVDSQFQVARFTVKVPWGDAAGFVTFIDDLKQETEKSFGPEVKIDTTGLLYLLASTIGMMMHSTKVSYLVAGVVISILMILLLRSIKLGLISMYPNLFPILIVMGGMGWMNVPLDMFKLLIGSIAIGLVVDDTIHFMHNYQRYFEETGSAVEAVKNTIHTTGRALLTTTVALASGFSVFALASMVNLVYFGLLTALILVLALFADLIITPAIMVLIDRDR